MSSTPKADIGGPKNKLQFTWTSQMNARLFCGDLDSRQHFSELVDVTAVQDARWQDTRVYALFKNEWYKSIVFCMNFSEISVRCFPETNTYTVYLNGYIYS